MPIWAGLTSIVLFVVNRFLFRALFTTERRCIPKRHRGGTEARRYFYLLDASVGLLVEYLTVIADDSFT